MNGRGLVEVSALILATLATAGVFMYSRGVQGTAEPMVAVVVSNADIPARTDLNELIKDEQFKIIYVPESVVLDGAVTSVHQEQAQQREDPGRRADPGRPHLGSVNAMARLRFLS